MNDDITVGRLFSRREAVTLLGTAGAVMFTTGLAPARASTGTSVPSCVVRPEQTAGPYFVEERLNRSDIRSDTAGGPAKSGTPLTLTLNVSRLSAGNCRPLEGAQVDIWHCDALGVYSDVDDPGFNTVGRKFLRGYQATDAHGEARFVTVYPGWYAGRTVHIHFMIRSAPGAQRGFSFTSQWYFDDTLTDRIHASGPYAERGQRRARNTDDRIFRRGGEQLMLLPTSAADGYAASFAVALQLA